MQKKPFIYFDLGNVVFDFNLGLERLSQELSVPLEDILSIFSDYDELACSGEITEDDLLGIYESSLNSKTDITNFADFWIDSFEPIHETHLLIRDLHENGFKIGILSNIYPNKFTIALDRGYIPDIDYSAVVLSCEEGYVKPQREFYNIAMRRAQTKEIFFVDDIKDNLERAAQIGWETFWFDKNGVQRTVAILRSRLMG